MARLEWLGAAAEGGGGGAYEPLEQRESLYRVVAIIGGPGGVRYPSPMLPQPVLPVQHATPQFDWRVTLAARRMTLRKARELADAGRRAFGALRPSWWPASEPWPMRQGRCVTWLVEGATGNAVYRMPSVCQRTQPLSVRDFREPLPARLGLPAGCTFQAANPANPPTGITPVTGDGPVYQIYVQDAEGYKLKEQVTGTVEVAQLVWQHGYTNLPTPAPSAFVELRRTAGVWAVASTLSVGGNAGTPYVCPPDQPPAPIPAIPPTTMPPATSGATASSSSAPVGLALAALTVAIVVAIVATA